MFFPDGISRRTMCAALAGAALGNPEPFFLPPLRPAPNNARPWLWYAPVITGRYPNASLDWIFGRLRERGFAICGVDVGESYGSPAGRAVYTRMYEAMIRDRRLSPRPHLLPQSRGGLMLYNWVVEHPEAVSRIGGIYPVCDLKSYPGLATAAPAYGMSEAELQRQLPRHNPIDRLAPLAVARVPILHLHGDSDKVVPLEANSGTLIRRYRQLEGPGELQVIPGKGHEEVPEFFHSERLVEFFLA